MLKSWCFWTVLKTLESPMDCKEIQPVHPKEISPESSLEGLMLNWNSNTLATWCKELIHLKRPGCWESLKGMTEDEMVGWHHWLDGQEFEWAPGTGDCVHGVTGSWTWLNNWPELIIYNADMYILIYIFVWIHFPFV